MPMCSPLAELVNTPRLTKTSELKLAMQESWMYQSFWRKEEQKWLDQEEKQKRKEERELKKKHKEDEMQRKKEEKAQKAATREAK